MKKIEIEIPEGKEAKWVNDVLMLVDEKPIEYKFKVGDKVKITIPNNPQYGEITKLGEYDGEPLYTLKSQDVVFDVYERYLEPFTQGITERIKTFEDAMDWCNKNHNRHFTGEYEKVSRWPLPTPDLLAFLKLRIITAALNEGWEPTCEMRENGELVEDVFVSNLGNKKAPVIRSTSIYSDSSAKLCFKSEDLALYAAKQFRDIYADFCGCKKGDGL